ncbi:FAD-binding oxidoreductase [Aciditerrimonas ferrireducens]|uniref:FAD-binding oxidoreductase n=1 Tax=Aciditerrimonas ferrireducens TaxID=667306 RepID=A0ABV6C5L5_9ACTN
MPERSWWGWGTDTGALSDEEVEGIAEVLRRRFGVEARRRRPPAVSQLDLPAPRVSPPRSLAEIASMSAQDRAGHAMGKAFRDVVRALRGQLDHPPDAVLRPRSEAEVAAVLDWCSSAGIAAVPYGGGSSVVGGVEPDVGEDYAGAVSVDLGALDQVLEIDEVSQAARVQAGVLGPSLEAQLRPAGLTLRHFPQSFEFSTLGGWVATRAGGHFATGPTHIDDLVEALRVVTPAGTLETRRLPGSGAGPSPDRLFLGSEGSLGVITEAWVRLRPRPRFRAGGSCRFPDFLAGARAVRALAQSGLMPANCRLVDPVEAQVNGIGDGHDAVLLVGFESADHPVTAWAARAEELVRDHGGVPEGSWTGGETPPEAAPGRPDASAAWRDAFLRAPYVRDVLVQLGMVCETFETAVTWDRFEHLHATVTEAVRGALEEVGASTGVLTCRFTHVYPDGPAPYFTLVAPGREGAELEQWDTVKAAAQEAVLAAGGTVTHHHAVGRVHRPWYDRQRPALFGAALQAAKATLDPAWVCNPGVLVDKP